MAPQLALAALLLNIATTQATISSAFGFETSAFWTYTSRLAAVVTPSPYTYYDGETTTFLDTSYRSVKETVTPTASPTSTSTYFQDYNDLQVVYAYYPTGAVSESDLEPARTYDSDVSTTSTTTRTYIDFSMPVTMTAPASCPTPFTVTTTASVTVPTEVTGQVTPTSTEDGTTSTAIYGDVYYYRTWYLSAGAAPFTTTSDYYYEYYIASCSTPPASYTTGSPRSGGSDDNDDSNSSSSRYCYYYCGTALRTWIIIVASVIPGLFLLGFLESWFWFRRLMLGKSAMRFGTVCWIFISLWVLCFTRMQDRRNQEDQKLLAEKWKAMGSGAAFKAWWKWGFRHAYPVEHLGQFSRQTVGIVPAGAPLNPAMAQAPYGSPPGGPGAPPPGGFQPVPGQPGQVYYYGPPPPGWVQAPNGGFVPPQGYAYPPPQQAGGYYGDMAKDGSAVSSSPVSANGPQHPAYQQPYQQPPQAPQPVYTQANTAQAPTPSPPPQTSLPPHTQPPQASVSPVSEAPDTQAPRPRNNPPAPPPPRNDPNDRDLYE